MCRVHRGAWVPPRGQERLWGSGTRVGGPGAQTPAGLGSCKRVAPVPTSPPAPILCSSPCRSPVLGEALWSLQRQESGALPPAGSLQPELQHELSPPQPPQPPFFCPLCTVLGVSSVPEPLSGRELGAIFSPSSPSGLQEAGGW